MDFTAGQARDIRAAKVVQTAAMVMLRCRKLRIVVALAAREERMVAALAVVPRVRQVRDRRRRSTVAAVAGPAEPSMITTQKAAAPATKALSTSSSPRTNIPSL